MHEKFKGSLAGVGVALCLLCWPGSLPAVPVATNAVAGVHFKGTSTLHDFEGHATSAPFALTIDETPNMITFDRDLPVQLDDFSLTPPSVLGIIHVGNEVRVHCTVSATPDGRSENGGDYSGLHTPD